MAQWHSRDGGGAHADTAVFAELPLPWEVVLDGVACPADLVRTVCQRHSVDADTAGWTSAYQQAELAEASPAPDLVHGVVVGSPLLAAQLRKAGYFSGQW